MAKVTKKTYVGWKEAGVKRKQIEYTAPTRLLDDKGNLLVKGGWARHNVFEYDRTKARPQMRGKEWDFYQVCNGKYMVQISMANISIGGYASANLVDISGKSKKVISSMALWLGGKNKVVMPENCDRPNVCEYKKGKFLFRATTEKTSRTLEFHGPCKDGFVEAKFQMDLFDDHQNITIVTPFKKKDKYKPTRFFMTMKQNCMPCEGTFKCGDKVITFEKKDTFCVLDWGRGVWPYKNVWYWGNGAQYIKDEEGNDHIFGFEITWGIGDESNATETCLFYDGVAHKIGSVDVEVFPKPDKYMKPWHFVSEDGRFDLTMTPFYDHHSDMNGLNIVRMHSHQVHGLWNGTVTLDDGKKLEIKDMYAFCEYVENKW
ncbi:MAG: DUF2804 domain-containing protein [Clostridiales bacterium]|nr:DUF2804 domain-containing protein [Clostridiales bacterium]